MNRSTSPHYVPNYQAERVRQPFSQYSQNKQLYAQAPETEDQLRQTMAATSQGATGTRASAGEPHGKSSFN